MVHHLAEKLIRNVGYDNANGFGESRTQTSGDLVGLVIHLTGGPNNFFTQIFADSLIFSFTVQYQRYRTFGYPEAVGYILHGDSFHINQAIRRKDNRLIQI